MVVMDTVNINCVHTQNGNGDSRLNGGHGYSEYQLCAHTEWEWR